MATVPSATFTHTAEEIDAAVDAVAGKASQEDLDALAEAVEEKQDALTFDSTPTANSDNPVESKGIKSYVDTAVSGEADARKTACNILADAGTKNMFKITSSTTLTNGVRFTVNSDGTVTVNRESSSSSNAIFTMARLQDIGLYGSNLIMSGCPSGGSSSTYRMQLFISSEISNVSDYGNGATININQADTIQTSNISIIISSSYSPNNLVFKPMVRHSEITDATYQPYAPTNRELYEMILALQ